MKIVQQSRTKTYNKHHTINIFESIHTYESAKLTWDNKTEEEKTYNQVRYEKNINTNKEDPYPRYESFRW